MVDEVAVLREVAEWEWLNQTLEIIAKDGTNVKMKAHMVRRVWNLLKNDYKVRAGVIGIKVECGTHKVPSSKILAIKIILRTLISYHSQTCLAR